MEPFLALKEPKRDGNYELKCQRGFGQGFSRIFSFRALRGLMLNLS